MNQKVQSGNIVGLVQQVQYNNVQQVQQQGVMNNKIRVTNYNETIQSQSFKQILKQSQNGVGILDQYSPRSIQEKNDVYYFKSRQKELIKSIHNTINLQKKINLDESYNNTSMIQPSNLLKLKLNKPSENRLKNIVIDSKDLFNQFSTSQNNSPQNSSRLFYNQMRVLRSSSQMSSSITSPNQQNTTIVLRDRNQVAHFQNQNQLIKQQKHIAYILNQQDALSNTNSYRDSHLNNNKNQNEEIYYGNQEQQNLQETNMKSASYKVEQINLNKIPLSNFQKQKVRILKLPIHTRYQQKIRPVSRENSAKGGRGSNYIEQQNQNLQQKSYNQVSKSRKDFSVDDENNFIYRQKMKDTQQNVQHQNQIQQLKEDVSNKSLTVKQIAQTLPLFQMQQGDQSQIQKKFQKKSSKEKRDSSVYLEESDSKKRVRQTKKVLVEQKEYFFYQILEGNNSQLIRRVLKETRGEKWMEYQKQQNQNEQSLIDFRWSPVSQNYFFKEVENSGIYNHFEFHREVSDKANLIQNMRGYCQKNGMNVFDFTPLSFLLDIDDVYFERELKEFLNYFTVLQEQIRQEKSVTGKKKKKQKEIDKSTQTIQHSKNSLTVANLVTKEFAEIIKISRNLNSQQSSPSFKNFNKQSFQNEITSFPPLPNSFHDNKNIWIFKPCDLNRGRGVQVFNKLENLAEIILNMYYNATQIIANQNNLPPNNTNKNSPKNFSDQTIKSTTPLNQKILNQSNQQGKFITKFIIQKYIESPLLIYNRKFDIRIWVLIEGINNNRQCNTYVFREGYIRTSSDQYDITENGLKNKLIHLTNNAIQKFGKNYGMKEDGNQMNFSQFQQYLVQQMEQKQNCFQLIQDKIEQIIQLSLKSVKKKINKLGRKNCFEILGYDFMIDQNLNPWIIEINTNPCLEESSSVLKQLMPRMIDDAFKLTLDVYYNQKQKFQQYCEGNIQIEIEGQQSTKNNNQIKQQLDEFEVASIYKVDGYKDNQNLWKNLFVQV